MSKQADTVRNAASLNLISFFIFYFLFNSRPDYSNQLEMAYGNILSNTCLMLLLLTMLRI